MENFDFNNPVKILFGKGKISELANQIPINAKILVTYGGGSIKNNDIYNQVMANLHGFEIFEFGGIEPNPTYETCIKALDIINDNNINFLLAVGGGSVIDATKFIAASANYVGVDSWDILAKSGEVKKAIPIGTVLTLPATGSEMNGNSVITKKTTQEKFAFGSPFVLPKFSILDPEYTYSLPKHQVANGIVDAFIHVMEQYLTYPSNSPVQDRFAEGVLLTLIEEGQIAFSTDAPNYENRANIMWAATMALNGLLSVGVKSDWATHQIGHELTALHGLDHAVTLAIVLPGLLMQKRDERSVKLLQYAERVWNITDGTDTEKMNMAISKTEEFFKSLGIKTKLSDYSIGSDTIDKIINRLEKRGVKKMGMQQDISLEEVRVILESR